MGREVICGKGGTFREKILFHINKYLFFSVPFCNVNWFSVSVVCGGAWRQAISKTSRVSSFLVYDSILFFNMSSEIYNLSSLLFLFFTVLKSTNSLGIVIPKNAPPVGGRRLTSLSAPWLVI